MLFIHVFSLLIILSSGVNFFYKFKVSEVVKQRNFEEEFVLGKISGNGESDDFFQNLPPETVEIIVSLLSLNTQLRLISCCKNFFSGDLQAYFNASPKGQNFREATIKRLMQKEMKCTFTKYKRLALETLEKQLDSYVKKNSPWLQDENNFIVQRYYFLTYFFKQVLMNNQVINYAQDYDGQKDFERLILLVTTLKNNCICSFDARYLDTQYSFTLYDYSNNVPYVYNPWCITIAYGKNNNLKTMLLYYKFYNWNHFTQRSSKIEEELFNCAKKEKFFMNAPENITEQVVRLAVVYNMKRGHEQCLYATETIKSLLSKINKERVKHLYITAIATQDNWYPKMYQSGHVFTKDEFPELLPDNTHVIMDAT